MDAGMNGAHGAAAARLAVEATSRDRGSVKGLSLEENLALVILESISAAMKRDALNPMRSAPSKTLAMLCGRKPPLETWLPLAALLMPQV